MPTIGKAVELQREIEQSFSSYRAYCIRMLYKLNIIQVLDGIVGTECCGLYTD